MLQTHLEYVMLIAFPQHQSLHERVWALRYTYIVCLIYSELHTKTLRDKTLYKI